MEIIAGPVYTAQIKNNNEQWEDLSTWKTSDQAVTSIEGYKESSAMPMRIIKRTLDVTPSGFISWNDILIVLDENGEWHPLYDPRANDPDWETYIRLKQKFNE